MNKKEKKILRSFTMVTQISITMLVPIFLCAWIGNWLNRLCGTQIIFPFMLLLGIGAAFRNVYILTKSFYMADMKKEHERLEYIENLKNYHKEHPEEYEASETDITRDDDGVGGVDTVGDRGTASHRDK